jgi:DNA-binding NarL/FixJ family response regulator
MTSNSAARVFLIDDHPAVRQGLALLLSQAGHQVRGEAGNHAEVRSLLASGQAEIAILDLHLGPETGFELIGEITAHGIPVLVYSMFEDAPSIRKVLDSGAKGYVCKREVAGELIRAVEKILLGRWHVSPVAEESLSAAGGDLWRFGEKDLSDRERQILELLGQGYGNHQIAEQLALSVRTVESYCTRAIDKLGLEGMKELRRYSVQNHRLPMTPAPLR